jgi:hypothetical protein
MIKSVLRTFYHILYKEVLGVGFAPTWGLCPMHFLKHSKRASLRQFLKCIVFDFSTIQAKFQGEIRAIIFSNTALKKAFHYHSKRVKKARRPLHYKETWITTMARFELARGDPNNLAGCLLNHSDTSSDETFARLSKQNFKAKFGRSFFPTRFGKNTFHCNLTLSLSFSHSSKLSLSFKLFATICESRPIKFDVRYAH